MDDVPFGVSVVVVGQVWNTPRQLRGCTVFSVQCGENITDLHVSCWCRCDASHIQQGDVVRAAGRLSSMGDSFTREGTRIRPVNVQVEEVEVV